ncbi:MAG TPA: hypothetical protein VFI03_02310 [Solirubrobacterales bacterium]|nr:hypothetical protein [Solirubrobacterales bacterium]
MNFLKKGPDLKLSEMRVPGFLQDIYFDLKDRHLLPVAAILIVAIVAVPIAVSDSGSDQATPNAEGTVAVQSNAGAQGGRLVAKSAPKLRDYRRRLEHLQAKDPFHQQYDSEDATAGGGAEGTSEAPSSETPTGEPPILAETPPSPEPGGGPSPTPSELTYYSYAIDVRISAAGADPGDEKQVTVRRNLPELTMLPSRETPAIVYMGSTRDGKKAVMTVSSDVQAIFGDAKCVLGSETCQLLAMEPNLPETFVYGGAGRAYKIELLKIHLVESDKLNRAPLGEPKEKSKPKSDG